MFAEELQIKAVYCTHGTSRRKGVFISVQASDVNSSSLRFLPLPNACCLSHRRDATQKCALRIKFHVFKVQRAGLSYRDGDEDVSMAAAVQQGADRQLGASL